MIKVIAFDLWDTLAIKRNPLNKFSQNIIEEFDLKLSKKEIDNYFQKTISTKIWETEYDAFTEFAKKIKISPTKNNILKLIYIKSKDTDFIIFDFVIKLFKILKKKRYKIGIISNGDMFSYNYFKNKTNLFDYVDYKVFSFQTGYLKPSPQIYFELQRQANVFNNEILIIGDDFENDFKAPKKLGFNSILFKDYESLLIELKKYNIEI